MQKGTVRRAAKRSAVRQSKGGARFSGGKTMSEYDKMRQSEDFDDDGAEPDEDLFAREKSEEEKYFEFYDDLKRTPKDDW